MKLESLLYRLKAEAYAKADRKWKEVRVDFVRRKMEKPPTVTEACRESARTLKRKTDEIWNEIRERRMLELAKDQHTRANVALLEANRTPAERKAQAEDVRDFQVRYSRLVPEASPDWRSQENPFAEHYRQQMTSPGRKKER
jgi:hypothetical protein